MRPEDDYPYVRNERALVLRVGTVAAVGTNTVDIVMPGGTTLPGVPSTFTPKVGAKVSVLLDRDNALAIGPVASGAPVWTPTTGMKVFQAQQTVSQSIPTGAYTPLSWNTVEDPYTSWSSGTPTRFKPTFAGNFLLTGGVAFSNIVATYANVDGRRIANWRKNGTDLATAADIANPSSSPSAVTARPYLVALNGTTDYVELAAWQNTGAALNTAVNPAYASTITVTYAGP